MTDNHGSEGPDKAPLRESERSAARALVSVIVPTFRRPNLLRKALQSVRAQTYRPLQVIVIDDDDDPAAAAIADQVLQGREDLQTIVLRQSNLGAAAARNRGLAAAEGAYVQFLDDDDELFPEKIAEQVDVLEGRAADIVYGDWIQGQDIPSARNFAARKRDDHFVFLTAEGWIPPFAYLSRIDACRSVGGWDETLRFNDDFDFFLRLAAGGSVFMHRPLRTGFYRWHSGPRVSTEDRRTRVETNMRIIEKAERLRRNKGGASPAVLTALIVYWRRLASEAADHQSAFDRCWTNIARLRSELGSSAGYLERALGPRRFYAIRAIGGPVQWGRRLAHRVLPLSARRGVRRLENVIRGAFGRAL